MMNDDLNDRIDLSALDPFTDPHRRDALVASIMERTAFELARRRSAPAFSVFGVLAGWARPALAAAAVLVLLSGAALQLGRADDPANTGVVEALSVPSPVESWLIEGRTPNAADLMLAIEEDASW